MSNVNQECLNDLKCILIYRFVEIIYLDKKSSLIYVFADKDNGRVNVKVNGHKTRDIRSHDLVKIECQL